MGYKVKPYFMQRQKIKTQHTIDTIVIGKTHFFQVGDQHR